MTHEDEVARALIHKHMEDCTQTNKAIRDDINDIRKVMQQVSFKLILVLGAMVLALLGMVWNYFTG